MRANLRRTQQWSLSCFPVMQCAKYEQEDIVGIWLKAYAAEKERQFIKCIDRCIPKHLVTLLDIGCGIGLHSQLWSERQKQVTASDFSTRFRDHFVSAYRLPFIWNDVLNSTIRGQYDICFCMSIGTILGDEGPRFRTFEALNRLMHAGSFLVLITPSNRLLLGRHRQATRMHSIDEQDIAKLRDLGLEAKRLFYWSNTPNRFWRLPAARVFARGIEAVGYHLGVGARKILICRRTAGE